MLTIIQSAADADSLMFLSTEGYAWSTSSCGKEVKTMGNGKEFLNLKYHPANASVILALVRKTCDKQGEAKDCLTYNNLELSENAGESFRVVKTHVHQFDWLKQGEFVWDAGNSGIIITECDNKLKSQAPTLPKNPQGVSTYFSWDLFKSQTRIVKNGYKYWLTSCCLFVETTDKLGKKSIHVTETYQNAFHWKGVVLRSEGVIGGGGEYFDYSIVSMEDEFTVSSGSSAAIHLRHTRERGRAHPYGRVHIR